jgi:hypothetical protein
MSGLPKMRRLVNCEKMIIAGGAISIVLLIPLSYAYTGKGPWEVFGALSDQKTAYEDVQALINDSAGTQLVGFVGAALAPFTFCALPLTIVNWARISNLARLLGVASGLSILVLSALKGTDRESAILIIVSLSALLVRTARQSGERSIIFSFLRRNFRTAVLALVLFAAATSLYVSRKEGRLGSVDSVCAIGTGVCADLDSTDWLGDRANFGVSSFVLSVTQGYYGLAVAMEKPFTTTYGLGHSNALLSAISRRTSNPQFAYRAYTSKIAAEDGWSDRFFWSTMMAWFANDVGFIGALVIVFLFAVGFGRSWRDSVLCRDDSSCVLFVLFMIIFFFLPLNNQMFLSLDTYWTFVAWLGWWLMPQRPR